MKATGLFFASSVYYTCKGIKHYTSQSIFSTLRTKKPNIHVKSGAKKDI